MPGLGWLLLTTMSAPPIGAVPADFEPATSVHERHAQLRPSPAHRTPRQLEAPQAVGAYHAIVYGYFAPWSGTVDDLPYDRLTHVAIFSVDLNPDGSLSGLSNWHDHAPQAMALAAPYGVKVHLAVTSFSSSTMSAVLGNAGVRATAVENLRALVDEYDADGIAVDFEGMSAGNRDDLVAFCEELAAVVDEVTVATPAVDWAGAYDYDALAFATDGLFIMGYDYHYKGGDPGPVAPLDGGGFWGMYGLAWSVDDYLTWGTPPEKIILGLPLYGYDWPTTGTNVPGSATGNASAVLYADAVVGAAAAGRQWDDVTSTPYYFPDGNSQAWYDDRESLDAKIAFAMDEGLGGIGFWAVNYEGGDPEFWDMVAGHTQTPDAPDPGGSDTGSATDGGDDDTGEPPAPPDDDDTAGPRTSGPDDGPAGGTDADAGSSGGPDAVDDTGDGGCACTAGASGPPWGLAVGLWCLMGLRRRRRAA